RSKGRRRRRPLHLAEHLVCFGTVCSETNVRAGAARVNDQNGRAVRNGTPGAKCTGKRMERPAEDRRVRRTRQALLQALIELTTEQGYEHVTVQGIAERANVGRTTFYAHFRDKEELLEKS